ncbi:MAG: hypothetical protein HYS13_12230 [Planctomycetia bacterium]|nr:hypothetical protein [Planctomycetia bacterium]
MQDVVLDTCCLINLYAAGGILCAQASSAARAKGKALDFAFHVPPEVEKESRYILQPDPDDPTKLTKVDVDLGPHFATGALHRCQIQGQAEADLLLQLVKEVDEGEAACFAVAKNRGWLLATDERLTENLARKHGVKIVTTPELVKSWADTTRAGEKEVASALWNIQTYAHYIPRKALPLCSWWMNLVKKATTS